MLFVPVLEASAGGDGDVKRMFCMVLNTRRELILDTLEASDILLRDSIQNSIAVVQSRAYPRTRNAVSDVLVDEWTYMPQGALMIVTRSHISGDVVVECQFFVH